jgi:hypothetical protein
MKLFAGLLATAIVIAFSSAAFARAKDRPNFGYTPDKKRHLDITKAKHHGQGRAQSATK